ncbi:MAG: alpha/beta hydrolase [Acidobacteria bacterium]|nr:alpha/beta hydrolase [Acidobacteriota bacterium]
MRPLRLLACLGSLALALAARADGAQPTAPTLSGHYEGAITIMGAQLAIQVDFTTSAQGLAATIDIPQQGVTAMPLSNVGYRPPQVHFELPAGPGLATFDGEAKGDEIAGRFTQGGAAGEFRIRRQALGVLAPPPAAAPAPYREEEVTFTSAAGTFAGTLTIPPGAGTHPAILLITGSGPQNRDEELFGFKPFRLIADHLTRSGIVVLRCDDRGVGGTTATRDGATTRDFADDALAAVAFLRTRPEVAATMIGLLGHSEGGVVAPMVAARSGDVAFIVLMSGTGVTGERVLLDQAELVGRAGASSAADIAAEAALQKRIFQAARSGSGWDEITADARGFAMAKLEALPAEQRQAIGDLRAYADRVIAGQLAMARSPWFKFFIDYDPAADLAKVHCPVLALFGEKDLQVPAESNRKAVVEALSRGGNRDVKVEVLPGANHLYQKATTGSPGEYPTLAKEFVPGFLTTISDWIRARTGLGG